MRTNLNDIQWCWGCWNFLILAAFKQAVKQLNIPNENIVVVSWIWCAGKITQYLPFYAAETLHWRSIPFWIWVKLANEKLKVICFWWDWDMYGIWLGHLLHAARKNIDITVIVHNNENYWLTTGQASPTTPKWVKTSSTPDGNPFAPFDAIKLLKSVGWNFVKRQQDREFSQLIDTIKKAIEYSWFSFIEILQACPSWKKW